MATWRILMLLATAFTMATMVVGEDKAKDKEECTNQLIGMATCLPYVQGQAKSPTPDCCTGLKQVLNSDKKCLCVIIQDRNDPDLGLQINVTLALSLPSVCHAPADVTKCPALLHMDPNSPEAQVFYQLGKGLNKTSPASGPSGSAPGPTIMSPTAGSDEGNTSGRSSSLPGKSHAYSFQKQWLISHVFVVLCIIFLI